MVVKLSGAPTNEHPVTHTLSSEWRASESLAIHSMRESSLHV